MLLAELGAGELWAMESAAFDALVRAVERIDVSAIVDLEARVSAAKAAADAQAPYTVEDGVARIDIQGTIFKQAPWLLKLLGIRVAATDDLSRSVRAAVADPDVRSILLAIDSPGGSVAGVGDLADEIHRATQSKPIVAAAQDSMNSAAYWLGSQASHVVANATAGIGSIGTYAVLTDASQAAEKAGVRVHVIRSGALKGAGVPGAAITEAQLEHYQDFANQTGEAFVSAVARGRRRTEGQIREHATGGFWLAPEAQARGLIDGIASMAEAHNFARAKAGQPALHSAPVHGAGRTNMDSTTNPAPSAAEQALIQARTELAEAKRAQAQAEAGAAANAAALGEIRASQRKAIIDRGVEDGRVTPPLVALVEAFAASCGDDLPKLQAFVAGLPVQTRPLAVGSANDGVSKPSGIEHLNAADLAACEALGVPPKLYARCNAPEMLGATFEGMALVQSGRRTKQVRLAEYLEIPRDLRAAWGSVEEHGAKDVVEV